MEHSECPHDLVYSNVLFIWHEVGMLMHDACWTLTCIDWTETQDHIVYCSNALHQIVKLIITVWFCKIEQIVIHKTE